MDRIVKFVFILVFGLTVALPGYADHRSVNDSTTLKRSRYGYIGMLEVGYLLGLAKTNAGRAQLDLVCGYRINPYFTIGAGAGLRYFDQRGHMLVPVYSNLIVNCSEDGTVPWFSTKFGLSLNGSFNGASGPALFLSQSAGAAIKIGDSNQLRFGLGYELMQINTLVATGGGGSRFGKYPELGTSREWLSGLGLNVGLSF